MTGSSNTSTYPSLPQNVSEKEFQQRQFQLSLARTSYNYMQSYLEGVPLSADLPKGEEFSLAYEAKVLPVFLRLADNFKSVVLDILEEEIEGDFPEDAIKKIEEAYSKFEEKKGSWHLIDEAKDIIGILESLSAIPEALRKLKNLPKDIKKLVTGMESLIKEASREGPTAMLKSTLYDLLANHQYLTATSKEDYKKLFKSLPAPQTLAVERKPWMNPEEEPYEQDWFFGYLQTGGYNTTNLQGVRLDDESDKYSVALSTLTEKFPVTDKIFQAVVGDDTISLRKAAQNKQLYVCDYSMLDGAKSCDNHGKPRFVAAPIALFYLNPNPVQGFPGQGEVLQPIAIQLQQKYDAETSPIFTPNNCSDANDENGLKWRTAKMLVNVVCAIQHENVAHLGACHLTIEPMVVAAHRQLSEQHPLLKLLIPHFRFTLNINDNAIHNLVIPGGVVANTVGLTVESSLAMVAEARAAWRWDEQCPDRLFQERGVDEASLPQFAFRDDTLLLWNAIKDFVSDYLKIYYQDDAAVSNDCELRGFINELVSPLYASFKGMNGLVAPNEEGEPYRIESLDYLIQIVSHMIYLAGPQHASVNYAQYPLMSYSPSVSGCIYHAVPTRSDEIKTEEEALKWCLPLDIALYTLSFEYLLTGVQYDTLGHYSDDPRVPYFADPRVDEPVKDFQERLSLIEIEIRKRNKERPMPYLFQLPSMVPNSTSI
ncbi:lipoxygenase family protein [Aliikangiella coralliicola]|uniref:Arachidonate 15-lipoxygenase n=1 Tax=Aliikangiella coralliicola TaxID=2592383 RepID=A0A545UFK0_9GAMM|nr:lipoxygenase family protein [Aliikangiella coralliicola]TQV88248.1 arachidonate 15-lipoxygenase [Aliikangiella coralliicola]